MSLLSSIVRYMLCLLGLSHFSQAKIIYPNLACPNETVTKLFASNGEQMCQNIKYHTPGEPQVQVPEKRWLYGMYCEKACKLSAYDFLDIKGITYTSKEDNEGFPNGYMIRSEEVRTSLRTMFGAGPSIKRDEKNEELEKVFKEAAKASGLLLQCQEVFDKDFETHNTNCSKWVDSFHCMEKALQDAEICDMILSWDSDGR